MRILLVDDDEFLMASLAQRLIRKRYAVDIAVDGSSACDYVELFDYDLIVLDLALPDGDGITFCRQFRRSGYVNPLMILSAQASTSEKVSALDAGADDYVIKPFDFDELCARIRALLRREHEGLPTVLSWGAVQLDPSICELTYDATPVPVTPKELSLMELFLRHPYRVHSLDSIIDDLWSLESPPSRDAIRTHVKGLRRKLQIAGAPKDLIQTVYGLGYRLNKSLAASYQSNSDRAEEYPANGLASKTHAPLNKAPLDKQSLTRKPLAKTQIAREAIAPLLSHKQSHEQSVDEQLAGETCRYLNNAQQLVAQLENAAATLLAVPQLKTNKSRSTQTIAQQQARTCVHKLAGSLGSFGLSEGSDLAQKIEAQFREHPQVTETAAQKTHSQATQLFSSDITQLIQQLRQYVDAERGKACSRPETVSPAQTKVQTKVQTNVPAGAQINTTTGSDRLSTCTIPTLLIVSQNSALTQALNQAAVGASFQCRIFNQDAIAPTYAHSYSAKPTQLSNALLSESVPSDAAPSVVIWDTETASLQASSATTAFLAGEPPEKRCSAPTIALANDLTLVARRRLAARGVRRIMSAQAMPARIMAEAKTIFLAEMDSKSHVLNAAIADSNPQFLAQLKASIAPPAASTVCLSTFTDTQSLWQWFDKAHPPLSESATPEPGTPDSPAGMMPVDILILNADMPDISGIELCRVLRTDARFQQLPILLLVSHSDPKTSEIALQAGADGCMSQAIATPPALARLIQRWRYRMTAHKATST